MVNFRLFRLLKSGTKKFHPPVFLLPLFFSEIYKAIGGLIYTHLTALCFKFFLNYQERGNNLLPE